MVHSPANFFFVPDTGQTNKTNISLDLFLRFLQATFKRQFQKLTARDQFLVWVGSNSGINLCFPQNYFEMQDPRNGRQRLPRNYGISLKSKTNQNEIYLMGYFFIIHNNYFKIHCAIFFIIKFRFLFTKFICVDFAMTSVCAMCWQLYLIGIFQARQNVHQVWMVKKFIAGTGYRSQLIFAKIFENVYKLISTCGSSHFYISIIITKSDV